MSRGLFHGLLYVVSGLIPTGRGEWDQDLARFGGLGGCIAPEIDPNPVTGCKVIREDWPCVARVVLVSSGVGHGLAMCFAHHIAVGCVSQVGRGRARRQAEGCEHPE